MVGFAMILAFGLVFTAGIAVTMAAQLYRQHTELRGLRATVNNLKFTLHHEQERARKAEEVAKSFQTSAQRMEQERDALRVGLSTEDLQGVLARDLRNLMTYDGTERGQEDLRHGE